jgi:hypothetical protein
LSEPNIITELEHALFRARNDKIKAFAGIYTLTTGECVEMVCIPDGQEVNMAGLTAILHRDVMVGFPEWKDHDPEIHK